MPIFRKSKPNLIPGYFNPDKLREDQIRRSEKLKVKLHGDGTVTLTHKDEQTFEKDGSELMYLAMPHDLITLWNISDYDLRHIECEIMQLPEKTDHVMSFGVTSHRDINTMMCQIGWHVECIGYNSKGHLFDGSKEMSGTCGGEWKVGDKFRVGICGHQVYFVKNNKLMHLKNHAADDISLRHKIISMAMYPGTAVRITSLGSKDQNQDPTKIKGIDIPKDREEYIVQSGEHMDHVFKNDREIREKTPGDIFELDQRPLRIKHALYVFAFYFFIAVMQYILGYKNGNSGVWAIFRPWARYWISDWPT